MKTLVIYRSKSGFVKNYAQWIGEELEADVIEASHIKPEAFNGYDTIIYGGGLYAVGINGIGLIKNNMDRLIGKNVLVFASGASPKSEKVIDEVKNKNFTKEQQSMIHFFYLRGGFDFTKLSTVDKLLMSIMRMMLTRKQKKKEELSSDERGMLAAYEKPADFTNRKNIAELIRVAKNQETKEE